MAKNGRKWRLAEALVKLREQVNALAPRRSKASDGTIGDVAHAGRKSDHNPDARGIVCAIDITHDPAGGMDAGQLAETLRLRRDRRIKYVIFNKRIFSSAVSAWEWRPYTGANAHKKHVHISVMTDAVNDALPWVLTTPEVQ